MLNNIRCTCLGLYMALLVPAYVTAQQPRPSPTVDRNNKFTLDFYYSLSHDKNSNVLVSPFSLSSALAGVSWCAKQYYGSR
jgi:serine protease inhibitor